MPSSMTFGFDCEIVVMFQLIHPTNCGNIIPVLVVIFLMGVLYEYIISNKLAITKKYMTKHNSNDSLPIENKLILSSYNGVISLLSYLLMFCLMSVSFWVAICLIFGSTLGYFLFGMNFFNDDNRKVYNDLNERMNHEDTV